jgi:hypothetical protein
VEEAVELKMLVPEKYLKFVLYDDFDLFEMMINHAS